MNSLAFAQKIQLKLRSLILLLQGWIKADFEAALTDLYSLMCDNKRYLKGVGACEA